MATYTGIGYDETNGRTRTGGVGDTISFDGLVNVTGNATVDTLTCTNDASVGGDLTVAGDIVSRGTVDLLVADNFIDLNAGNSSTAALGGGYTLQMNRTSGFTTKTATVFNAGASGTTATETYTVNSVAASTTVLLTFEYKGTTGLDVIKTIVLQDGGTTAFATGIDGFNTSESVNIPHTGASNDIIGIALRSLLGSLTYYATTTPGSDAVCVVTATNSLSDLTIVATANGSIAVSGATVGSGTAAFFTSTTGAAFTTGMIAIITAAADGGNDGIYLINKVVGNDNFIFGTNGFSLPTGIQFCQTVFTASTGDTASAYQPDLYIQAVSDGTSYNQGGTVPAKGVLIDTYDTAAEMADYIGLSSWDVVGASSAATTLQQAYDAGNTITTTNANGAIDFTFDSNSSGLTMDGDSAGVGDVTMGAGTTINTFTVDSVGAISLDTAAAANLSSTLGVTTIESDAAGAAKVIIAATNATGGVQINSGSNGLDIDLTVGGSGTGDGPLTINAAAASTIDVAGADLTLSTTTSGDITVSSAADLVLDAANEAFYCIGTFDANENVDKGNPLKLVPPTAAATAAIAFTAANINAADTMTLQNQADVGVVFSFVDAPSAGNNIALTKAQIATISGIVATGSGYTTGAATLASGSGTLNIDSVDGSGGITGVTLTFAGSGYTASTIGVVKDGSAGTVSVTLNGTLATDNNNQAIQAQARVNAQAAFTAGAAATNNITVTEAVAGKAPATANTTNRAGSPVPGIAIQPFTGGTNTRVAKARANSADNAKVVGFAQATITATNPVKVAGPGSLLADVGAISSGVNQINIGDAIYLSNTTAGELILSPPTALNSVVFQIGRVTGNESGAATQGFTFQPQFIAELG